MKSSVVFRWKKNAFFFFFAKRYLCIGGPSIGMPSFRFYQTKQKSYLWLPVSIMYVWRCHAKWQMLMLSPFTMWVSFVMLKMLWFNYGNELLNELVGHFWNLFSFIEREFFFFLMLILFVVVIIFVATLICVWDVRCLDKRISYI